MSKLVQIGKDFFKELSGSAYNIVCGTASEKEVGSKPKNGNIFKNMGSFTVSGDASFIRQIIDDPDIDSAVANKQPKKISK